MLLEQRAREAYPYLGKIEKERLLKQNEVYFLFLIIAGPILLVGGMIWAILASSSDGLVFGLLFLIIGVIFTVSGLVIQFVSKPKIEKLDETNLGEKYFLKNLSDVESEYLDAKERTFKKNALDINEDLKPAEKIILVSQHTLDIKIAEYKPIDCQFAFSVTYDSTISGNLYISDLDEPGAKIYYEYLLFLCKKSEEGTLETK